MADETCSSLLKLAHAQKDGLWHAHAGPCHAAMRVLVVKLEASLDAINQDLGCGSVVSAKLRACLEI